MVPSEWWEAHLLTKTQYFVHSYLRDLLIIFLQKWHEHEYREKRLNTTVFWVAWNSFTLELSSRGIFSIIHDQE